MRAVIVGRELPCLHRTYPVLSPQNLRHRRKPSRISRSRQAVDPGHPGPAIVRELHLELEQTDE